MDGLLRGPTGHKPIGPKGHKALSQSPMFEGTVNISCQKFNQSTIKRHKTSTESGYILEKKDKMTTKRHTHYQSYKMTQWNTKQPH